MIVEKKHLGTAKDNTGIYYLKRKVGIQCILDNKLCKKITSHSWIRQVCLQGANISASSNTQHKAKNKIILSLNNHIMHNHLSKI